MVLIERPICGMDFDFFFNKEMRYFTADATGWQTLSVLFHGNSGNTDYV